MALEHMPSRFAVLPDDVPEPTGKKGSSGDSSKAKRKKQAKQNDAKGDKKGSTSKAANNKGKSLKSLAFGGTSEGKKKGTGTGQLQSQNIQNLPPPGMSVEAGASGDGPRRGIKKGSEQWEEWRRRDSERVDETFESELEQALVQSKLDYQHEAKRKDVSGKGAKSKKKGITVPLNEFNELHLEAANSVKPPVDPREDEGLIEQYRTEARLQIEREKELQLQKEILAKRQNRVYKHPNSKERNKEKPEPDDETGSKPADENIIIIENLRAANELLQSELESYKGRLKKVHEIFQNAQELKEKAQLIFQVENLTRVQVDLQQEVQTLHSQLEQERSRSHAAIVEYRKLLEQTRKRTQTESST